jgi:hypothetical protein
MSKYVNTQYEALKEADSITVDPHKAGYVPYPAGGLCYQNSSMRDLISLKAPVIFQYQNEPTVGIYGVEGSKPGAAAAAVWLAHKVIPPTDSGYGRILGQCMWTSKRFYSRLVTMDLREKKPRYKVVPLPMLPAERLGNSPAKERKYIARHFIDCTNQELLRLLKTNPYARGLFADMGSDQVIVAYSINFKNKGSATWNEEVDKINKLIDKIFSICSVTDPSTDVNLKTLILTSSSFDLKSYGEGFIENYCRRLGVKDLGKTTSVSFLISTTMGPWTTDTPSGDFLAKVEDALRQTIYQALTELGY